MDQLNQKLLPSSSKQDSTSQNYNIRNRNRLTLIYEKNKLQIDSVFDTQVWQYDRKLYRSIAEEPEFNWNSQEIIEREQIMQEISIVPEEPILTQNTLSPSQSLKRQSKSRNTFRQKSIIAQPKKKKELNHYIFKLRKKTMNFIYYFNLLFNFFFRAGLIILVIVHLIGDKDPNQEQQQLFITILLGLEGLVGVLYFLAITKMLYTKSDEISVYFQKQFYEIPYAEIAMQRILRKHFTIKKIVKNLSKLANPFSKFSKDVKIAVMRQEIYKRIELIIVFVPLFVVFIIGTPWFDKSKQNEIKFDVQLLLAVVVCLELVRLIFHYLLIYIFS